MAVYIRLAGPKRLVNDTRSWKYYVFILIGLLVLIPVALMFFNSVLRRNKMKILSSVSRAPQWSWATREYKKPTTSGAVRDDKFDFIMFTQLYPVTSCLEEKSSTDKCHFAPDREAWTVHGIWPSDDGGMGPSFCKQVEFNVAALDGIRNELDEHWYSYKPGENVYFWEHEWKKHGSCAEELTAFDSELKYFKQGLVWNKQYNLNDMLEAQGIVPNNTKPYKAEDFENAINAYIGVKAIIHCIIDKKNNVSLISEIRLCFTKTQSLESCESLEKLSDCPPDGIIYPESTYAIKRS